MIRKEQRYKKQIFANRRNPKLYSRTEFTATEKKSKFSLKVILFLVTSGFIYVVFFSPAFKIQEVIVSAKENNKDLIQKKFEDIRSSFLGNNLLFLNTEKVRQGIMENSDFKEVTVEKSYVKKDVVIKVKERVAIALWSERGKNFYMDNDGIIFQEVGEKEEIVPGVIKINNNLVNLTSKVGERTLDQETVDFINSIISNFEAKTGDKIYSINFENSVNEITVLTNKNYKIFFDTKRDPLKQLENVLLVKKEVDKKNNYGLDYIDLRVETRIFYK